MTEIHWRAEKGLRGEASVMGRIAKAEGVEAWEVVARVHGLTVVERDARARLVAAAPDLLEALRVCMAKLEANGIGYDAFKIGSAAIAKATG